MVWQLKTAVVAGLLAAVPAMGAASAPASESRARTVDLNIAAQPLGKALNEFGRQTGLQVVFFYGDVDAGLTSPELKGSYTAKAALEKLLANTRLKFKYINERTISIQSANAAEGASALTPVGPVRLADTATAAQSGSKQTSETESEPTEVVVTGSLIRTPLGEATVSPVLTYTREDIERTGATSLADFKRYVPQLSVGDPARTDGMSNGATAQSRVTYNLRGLNNNTTLVLVNGRRLARSGQSNATFGSDDFDLNGIPLSAVERVEVLLDGASALYGADAMAGVINIILRKEYQGSEVRLSLDNTFDKDAAVKQVSITHGARHGNLSMLFSASFEEQNELANRDREWTATADLRRYGGSDGRFLRGGRGIVTAVTGNLNGLTTNVAAIPAGSDGRTTTIEDYANAGALPDLFDPNQYLNSINPSRRRSASLRLEQDFRSWLKPYLDARVNESTITGIGAPPSFFSVTLPAGYPGNPFGQPIRVQKIFWDQGFIHQQYGARNPAATLGTQGTLGKGWRYDTSLNWARSRQQVDVESAQMLVASVNAGVANPDPSLRPNLLYDSLSPQAAAAANPPGLLESYQNRFPQPENTDIYSHELTFDGPLFQLPAGPMRAAVGTSYRREEVEFDRLPGDPYSEPANGLVSEVPRRSVRALFAELVTPLVSPGMEMPGVHQLDLSLAARVDDYNDFGSGSSPRVGILYRPFSWLLLRGTRSRAFKVPTMGQLYTPVVTGNGNYSTGVNAVFDPLRNNEPLVGIIPTVRGGNPDLDPERSVNTNWGVMLEIPSIPGLSLSVDYWRIEQTDRVGGLTLQERLDLYPELFQRGAPDGVGSAGPITLVDNRSINVAEFSTAGIDYRVNWRQSTRIGELDLNFTATRTTEYELRPRAGAPAGSSFITQQRPWRAVTSLFWSRGAMDMGMTLTYTEPLALSALAVARIPSTTLADWSAGYDFSADGAQGGRAGWVGHLLKGTRVRLSILNVLNTAPDPSSIGLFSTSIDPRLRRYVIDIQKKF